MKLNITKKEVPFFIGVFFILSNLSMSQVMPHQSLAKGGFTHYKTESHTAAMCHSVSNESASSINPSNTLDANSDPVIILPGESERFSYHILTQATSVSIEATLPSFMSISSLSMSKSYGYADISFYLNVNSSAPSGLYTVSWTLILPNVFPSRMDYEYFISTSSEVPPIADFKGSPTSGFAPLTVTFSNKSAGTITSYSWDFGDGSTSSSQNPTHTYQNAGIYSVTLTASSSLGLDIEYKPNYITVSAATKPMARFHASPSTGEAPLRVQFYNQSWGSVNRVHWDFGDGETSSVDDPVHTYNYPGKYTVSLTASGPAGTDTETVQDCIDVTSVPSPLSDFLADKTFGVLPHTVSFTDHSDGKITSRLWRFGDGATSTETNPVHTYTSEGKYTVSLTTTGPAGADTKTRSNYINTVASFFVDQKSGTSARLVSVYFDNEVDGLIIGYEGDFLRTEDGGGVWINKQGRKYLESASFVSANLGWAVDYYGDIYKTENGGDTWVPQESGVNKYLNDICFTDTNHGWAVGSEGKTVRTTDGGKSWIYSFGQSDDNLNAVCFVNNNLGWAVGDDGRIQNTTDGGKTWNLQQMRLGYTLTDVYFINSKNGWVVGSGGRILFTNNGGASWSPQVTNTETYLGGVYFINQDKGWAYGSSGLILKTTNGGQEWQEKHSGTCYTLSESYFINENTGWIVGAQGTIVKTEDGGETWAVQTKGTGMILNTAYAYDSQTCWAAGDGGTIIKTEDAGDTWRPQNSGLSSYYYDKIQGITFINKNVGWVISCRQWPSKYEISKTVNGGDSWEKLVSDGTEFLKDIDFYNENTGWVVGYEGYIAKTTNGGRTWSSQNSNLDCVLYDIQVLNDKTCWIVGYKGGGGPAIICNTTDGGATWLSKSLDENGGGFYNVHFINDSTGWIAGSYGIILKTTDSGNSWVKQETNTESSLRSIKFLNENTGCVVGSDGVCLYTDDGGNTWVVIEPPPDIKLNAFTFGGDLNGWAVGGGGAIHNINMESIDFTGVPVAGFSASTTSGDAPLAVQFTDLSSGKITSWLWDFGDGSNSSSRHPGHTYDVPGEYEVKLTISGPSGEDVKVRRKYISAYTSGNFIVSFNSDTTNGLNPLTVNFFDQSIGPIDSWLWDFGDGQTSNDQNPVHIYSQTGTYNVSLTVSGPDGDATSINESYIVVSDASQIEEIDNLNPTEFKLYANYPNPFNPDTHIVFSVPKQSEVTISVYNINGELVEKIFKQEVQEGHFDVVWDAAKQSSGVYFIYLNAGQYQKVHKCILLK